MTAETPIRHDKAQARPTIEVVTFYEQQPTEPQKFRFGDPVTRENWASFVVHGFQVSGGSVTRQALETRYIGAQTGIDTTLAVGNFLAAGGWNVLSGEEKQLITQRFDRVKAHATAENGKVATDFHADPGGNIRSQLQIVSSLYTQVLVDHFEGISGAALEEMDRNTFITNLNEQHPTPAAERELELVEPTPDPTDPVPVGDEDAGESLAPEHTDPDPATEPDKTATPDTQKADAAQQPSDATKSDIPNDEPAIDQSATKMQPKTVFDAHQPETTEDTTTTTPKLDETVASSADEVPHQQDKSDAVEDPQPTPPQEPPAQQAPPPPAENQPAQTEPAPPVEPEPDTPKNQDTVPHEDAPTASTENEQHASFSFRNTSEESTTSDTTRKAVNEAAVASAEPSVPSPQPDTAPEPDPVDDHNADVNSAPSVSPE